jgi:hypothetical protein
MNQGHTRKEMAFGDDGITEALFRDS